MIFVDSYCYDIGTKFSDPIFFTQDIINKTKSAWISGADVVVFPEYLWMALVQYKSPHYTTQEVAELFWKNLFPILKAELSNTNHKTVILGSVPRVVEGKLYNTTIVINAEKVIFQDKISLTPWESEFKGGIALHRFNIKGATCVVNICLDIEMPKIAELLKQSVKPDIIFVPSATETEMGAERIARCASSKAVELGAVVITSSICGVIEQDDFLGQNYGRSAMYIPALKGLENFNRVQESKIQKEITTVQRFEIDESIFDITRNEVKTTNPANIFIPQQISA